MKPACKDCRYAEATDEGRYTCHYYAPGPELLGTTDSKFATLVWPVMKPNEWCSEFRGRRADQGEAS